MQNTESEGCRLSRLNRLSIVAHGPQNDQTESHEHVSPEQAQNQNQYQFDFRVDVRRDMDIYAATNHGRDHPFVVCQDVKNVVTTLGHDW